MCVCVLLIFSVSDVLYGLFKGERKVNWTNRVNEYWKKRELSCQERNSVCGMGVMEQGIFRLMPWPPP